MVNAMDGIFNGDNIIGSIGDFLTNLAKLMIEFGVLTGLMGTGQALFESGNPYAMIAGGILIAATAAAATAAKLAGSVAGLKSAGSGAGAGGSVSGGGGYGGGGYDYNRELVFVIRGNDLVASYDNNKDKNAYNGF